MTDPRQPAPSAPELPRLTQPAPARFYPVPGEVGGVPAVMLMVESVNGTWCFPLHPEAAAALSADLRTVAQTQAGAPPANGLIVPTVDLRSLGDLRNLGQAGGSR